MKKTVVLIAITTITLFWIASVYSVIDWSQTTTTDYNTGAGFDFNWTKAASDGNVMPTGSDRIYNNSDQMFYDENLLVYFRFNDVNADGSGVSDDTNNGNSGHLLSGADVNAYGLWDTNAGFFDGVNNSISITNNSKLQQDFNTGIITITAWIYARNVSAANRGIVSKSSGGGATTIIFEFATNTGQGLKLYVGDGIDNSSWNSTSAFDLNKWQHVAVAMNGSSYWFYINGMPAGNGTLTRKPASVTNNIQIGVAFNQGSSIYYFDGYIEELKIYNRALTASEITLDYNAWMTGKYYSEIKDLNGWSSAKLTWQETVDQNNSIIVDYRSCGDPTCSENPAWVTGLKGGNAEHSLTGAFRYLQYKVNFDTNKQNWNSHRANGNLDKGNYARFYDANTSYNRIPDVNVTKIETRLIETGGLPFYSYITDQNLTIDFNFFDWDGNFDKATVDINYSTTNTLGTGTVITEDVNLAGICTPGDWNMAPNVCSWDWNSYGVGDNNYYVLIKITDELNDTNFSASQKTIGVDNNGPATTATQDGANIIFACADYSGCKTTGYKLDGGTWVEGLGVGGISGGTHTIDYNSIDIVGNNEAVTTLSFTVGTGAPAPGTSGGPTAPTVVVTPELGIDYNWTSKDFLTTVLLVKTSLGAEATNVDELEVTLIFEETITIDEITGESMPVKATKTFSKDFMVQPNLGEYALRTPNLDLMKTKQIVIWAKKENQETTVEFDINAMPEPKPKATMNQMNLDQTSADQIIQWTEEIAWEGTINNVPIKITNAMIVFGIVVCIAVVYYKKRR